MIARTSTGTAARTNTTSRTRTRAAVGITALTSFTLTACGSGGASALPDDACDLISAEELSGLTDVQMDEGFSEEEIAGHIPGGEEAVEEEPAEAEESVFCWWGAEGNPYAASLTVSVVEDQADVSFIADPLRDAGAEEIDGLGDSALAAYSMIFINEGDLVYMFTAPTEDQDALVEVGHALLDAA